MLTARNDGWMNDIRQIDRRAVLELWNAYTQLKKIDTANIKRCTYHEYM